MPEKWARPKPGTHGLRRGAWYPVVNEMGNAIVVLDVRKNNVPVHRDMLLVVDGTPEHWTVVEWQESQRGAQRASETDFGMMYGVCPNCSQRARIDRDTQDMECPECGRRSSIDWENLA